MGRVTQLKADATPGVFAKNAEFFPSDIISGAKFDAGSTKIIVTILVRQAVKLQATIDGTIFGYMNSNIPLIPNTIMELGIRVKHGAKFNLRTDDADGVTVDFCEIHEDRR